MDGMDGIGWGPGQKKIGGELVVRFDYESGIIQRRGMRCNAIRRKKESRSGGGYGFGFGYGFFN
jgi:hypothetical protein